MNTSKYRSLLRSRRQGREHARWMAEALSEGSVEFSDYEKDDNRKWLQHIAASYRSNDRKEKKNNRNKYFSNIREARKDEWAHVSQNGSGAYVPKEWADIRRPRTPSGA